MDRSRLARHLVRAPLSYYEAALWRYFDSNEVIGVHVPDQPAPVFASIAGPLANHALQVFRGGAGLYTIQA